MPLQRRRSQLRKDQLPPRVPVWHSTSSLGRLGRQLESLHPPMGYRFPMDMEFQQSFLVGSSGRLGKLDQQLRVLGHRFDRQYTG